MQVCSMSPVLNICNVPSASRLNINNLWPLPETAAAIKDWLCTGPDVLCKGRGGQEVTRKQRAQLGAAAQHAKHVVTVQHAQRGVTAEQYTAHLGQVEAVHHACRVQY